MGEWFKESFGEDYKIVYRHRNEEHAGREVAAMIGWMDVRPGAAVLDVGCGMGRHSLALNQLGYQVTGLDLSSVLLEEARQAEPGGEIAWVQGDMRQLPFQDGAFAAVVNWFTSFGYFADDADNARALGEMKRVLEPEGMLLIDFLNPEYVKRNLVPYSRRTDADTGWLIEERRTIEEDFVVKQITVTGGQSGTADSADSAEAAEAAADGGVRHYEERVRLIGLERFRQLYAEAGLTMDYLYGDYDASAYDEASSKRLIMLGRRER